jgi:hypothetical protein
MAGDEIQRGVSPGRKNRRSLHYAPPELFAGKVAGIKPKRAPYSLVLSRWALSWRNFSMSSFMPSTLVHCSL